MKQRKRISDGAFPAQKPDSSGNHEQRRAWRAIEKKKQRERRRLAVKELRKMPPNIQKLVKANNQLTRAIDALDPDGKAPAK